MTSAAAATPTLAALLEDSDYRRAQMVDLDPVEEAVMEKMGHYQDYSPSRALDLFPVLTMDLMVLHAGRVLEASTILRAVALMAAVVSTTLLPMSPEVPSVQDFCSAFGNVDIERVGCLASSTV